MKMVSRKEQEHNMELLVQDISQRIEDLKIQFNLFFTGEIRVPPEKERGDLEKRIRNLIYAEQKSPRLSLLIQNVSSRFSLYNNMWLKKLNEIETGVSVIKRKPTAYMEEPKAPPKSKTKTVNVSLNSEESFEKFFDNYVQLLGNKAKTVPDKEQVINSLKSKLITSNVIDAKVSLSIEKGKVKIKIKSEQ
ncbi:MAG: hypothetical protein GTO45_31935 [Candidatus Aminicenantes bacterium]|nr:hypothetical protein [Candidatus Aminicenantes bacterium]NIM77931.1 hypothetical protein [Candidatus Aminicenantes bacterium]NIN22748.1 hypothetical protein [Candidatus Aminicenantes bacterium]NIN45914.1 hypothetical protein [Candidatus Aminicenantes bacterium]NIN89390.1 hypothetical protein [Candidatus Aminicenantes bacterium]